MSMFLCAYKITYIIFLYILKLFAFYCYCINCILRIIIPLKIQ